MLRPLFIACLLSTLAVSIRADDVDAPPVDSSLRALIVPAETPAAWPEGDWLGIPAAEYAEFIDWLNRQGVPDAPAGVLGVAQYTAEFDGHDLIQGDVTFEVPSQPDMPRLVQLGEFTTRMQDLQWQDGTPATWGVASDQGSCVWVDRDESPLTATWFQQGKRYTTTDDGEAEDSAKGFVRFDLTLPAALTSRLRLRVPASRYLICTEGLATNRTALPETELNEWIIECGPRGKMTFVIFDEAPSDSRSPWLAEITTIANAKTDGLHFDAELTVEASHRLPQELELRIPRELTITSVQTASETALEYRVTEDGSRGTLQIALSQAVTQRAVFRIRGIMPLSTRREMVFPFLTVPDSRAVNSTWILKVDRPLEVRRIDPRGVLHTGLAVTAQGENWSFTPLEEEPHLEFEVGLPETTLTTNTWTLVDLTSPIPESTTVTELLCERGSLYTSEWVLPADWAVASVQSSDFEIASWTTSLDPEATRQRLTVELREPLQAGERGTVEIIARSPPWRVDEPHSMPDVHYADRESGTTELLLRLPPEMEWIHNATGMDGPHTQLAEMQSVPLAVSTWWNAPFPSRLERWVCNEHGDATVCRLVRATDTDANPVLQQAASPGAVAESESGEMPRCQIIMETHIAGIDRWHHLHQCRFELQPHQESFLRFTWDAPAESLDVLVDGRHVEPQILDEVIQIGITPETREVRIDYVSPASSGILTQDEIPLPKTNFNPVIVHWKVLLPADRGLATPPSRFVVARKTGEMGLMQRLLGPLARDEVDAVFGIPVSSEKRGNDPDFVSPASLILVSGGDIDRLRIALWDVRSVRSASWTSLLGAFLLLLTLRRLLTKSWKYAGVFCAALGFAGAWFGSPPVALVSGGLLMGTLLAAAIPRRHVQAIRNVDEQNPKTTVHGSSLIGSSAVGLFVIAALAAGDTELLGFQLDEDEASLPSLLHDETAGESTIEVDERGADGVEYDLLIPMLSDDAAPADTLLLGPRLQHWHRVWSESRHSLPWLIHSARYELAFPIEGLPVVNAELTVQIPSEDVRKVLLPFQDVVVVNAEEATWNGQPITLIPDANGQGLLLLLPDESEPPDSRDSGDAETEVEPESESTTANTLEYQSATIRLSFRIREASSAAEEPHWEAGIPRVPQTDVVLAPADSASLLIAGSTTATTEGDRLVLPLPPAERLSLRRTPAVATESTPRVAVSSSIELGPNLSRVSAELELVGPAPSGIEPWVLPVRLPPGSILQGIQPEVEVEHIVDERADELVVWLIIPGPAELTQPIELDYLLTTERSTSGSCIVPPLEYGLGQDRHLIEVTPRPGYQWRARPQSSDGIHVLDADERTQHAIATATPDTVVAQLAVPIQTAWSIEPISPEVSIEVDEQLDFSVESSTWTSALNVETTLAPVFQYVFEIDPSLTVRSVSVQRDEAERMLRWRQSEGRLVVFVQSDPPGTRQIRIAGTLDVSRSTPFQWPRFELADAEVEAHRRHLVNDSGRELAWESAIDEPRRLASGQQLTFDNAADAPTNLQFESVDENASVKHAIWFVPAGPDGWTMCQRLEISSSAGALPPQTVRLPASWPDGVGIHVADGTVRQGTDDEGRYVRIEAAEEQILDLILLTHLPVSESSPDMALIAGAATESTTLYLPRSARLDATDWVELEAIGVPPSLASDELASVTDWVAYHPSSGGGELPTLPDAVALSRQRILHAETNVFVSLEMIIGETQYDLATGGQATISLARPSRSIIQAVSVDGDPVAWDQDLTIPIPRDQACAHVSVLWSAETDHGNEHLPLPGLIPLQNSPMGVQHFFCCWNQTDHALQLPDGAVAVSRQELWSERWHDLGEVADRLPSSLRDHPSLVWRISQCAKALGELNDAPAQLSEQRGEVQSGDIETLASRFPSWDAAHEGQWTAYRMQIGGIFVEPDSVTSVPPAQLPWRSNLVGAILSTLIVLAGIWALRRPALDSWNDRLARHPRVVWVLLGAFWWLLLSPSIVGVVIIATVVVHSIYRGLVHLFGRSRSPLAMSGSRQ